MGDYPNPNVVTVVKIGGFTLYCKAFRHLTKISIHALREERDRNFLLRAYPKISDERE